MSKGRIDVHHHILPTHYVESVGEHPVAVQGSSGRVPTWGIEHSLEAMDAAGIQTAITSLSAPGLAPADKSKVAYLARWCNDFAAGMGRDHPGRFGMFATLPLLEIDAALAEVAYSFDVLKADGACLLSNYGGRYLGDPFFRPLYEELNRRKAVVFVHPTSPQSMVQIDKLSASTLEFTFDTTRTAASLVFGKVLTDFPGIRWIMSHAGGTIPFLCGRVDVLTTNNATVREKIPNGFKVELAKLYFDTALSANPATLHAVEEIATTDHILFGSDYPFGPKGQMNQAAAALDAMDWDKETLGKINRDTAAALFPRFA
ncbi:MAG: amidohydrolase family protein [Pseudomonadota bacterium]